jgi:4-hydroxy-2-oxoheptanedioate aldolase
LKTLFGTWVTQPSTIIVELVARSGSDFVVLDLQHSLLDFQFAAQAIQLLDVLGVESFVRIPFPEIGYLPRLLDYGLQGAIVANVASPEQVSDAVAITRYQPDGTRSYGGQRFGLRPQPERVRTIQPKVYVIVETKPASDALDDIAATPGLAGLVLGPGDLSLALGVEVQEWATSPIVARAMERVRLAAVEHGIEAWAWATDGEDADAWAGRGYHRVSVGSDMAHLRAALESELARARGKDSQFVAGAGGYGGTLMPTPTAADSKH